MLNKIPSNGKEHQIIQGPNGAILPSSRLNAWNSLSMSEKAVMMRVAAANGITDLREIRRRYNEFAEGGDIEGEDSNYYSTMERVAEENYKKWGFSSPDEALLHVLNDNTYDYRGYYSKYPQSQANADTHWTDEFKTVYHPTFSDESIYSGKKSEFNPLGLPGGMWIGETFIPKAWQVARENMKANKFGMGGSEQEGQPEHVYETLPRLLQKAGLNVRVTSGYRKPGAAGKAGNKSWHTKHGAVDIVPQGKTTFEDIENALYSNPEIVDYMLTNGLGLLDESGRSKQSKETMKKTGATGPHFHIGKDSHIANEYASRNWDVQMEGINQLINNPQSPISPEQTFQPLHPEVFQSDYTPYTPVLPDYKEEMPTETIPVYSPEEIKMQEQREGLNNLQRVLGMMNGEDSYNGLLGVTNLAANSQTSTPLGLLPMLTNGTYAYGGHIYDGRTEDTQKMDKPNLFKYPDGRYVYQASKDSKEIPVSPIAGLSQEDPALWTFVDAEGREYTPRSANNLIAEQLQRDQLEQEERQSNPLIGIAQKYIGELKWRAKNDPSSIALQGKYTLPAIAVTAAAPYLIGEGLPAAGEAFANATIANVPATTWLNTALTAGFAGHGLNHAINEGITGWGDAAMTALEIAPMLQVVKPAIEMIGPSVKPFVSRMFAGDTPAAEWSEAVSPTRITADNAASMTDTQWDNAYNAAVKTGDIAEAQRLRDLHFAVKAPDTKITDIQYHGSPHIFNIFDPKKIGNTDQGWLGKGYYFTPSKDYASMYGNPRAFYINAEDVYTGNGITYFGRESSPQAKSWQRIMERKGKGAEAEKLLDNLRFSDAVRGAMPQTKPYNGVFEEVVTRNNNQMKLSDAITYDDAGNIIPLSQRDNFGVNDIRYARDPSSFQAPYLHNGRQGLSSIDFTDFDTMVERMNSAVDYSGINPFKDGKITGFRKWALDNGASVDDILRVEKDLSGNNWSKLRREFTLDNNRHSAYIPATDKVTINQAEDGFNYAFPHEVEHRLFYKLFGDNRNSISVADINAAFRGDSPMWKMENDGRFYFFENNFEEIINRFTQIKNALGIKEARALTAEELKKAYRMFKSGSSKIEDNNMAEFFDGIKDWKAAAKLSGKALTTAGVGYSLSKD